MIRYPLLHEGAVIGVTAPSSGTGEEWRPLLDSAIRRMEQRGFQVVCGETPWTQHKAKSAPARVRAAELDAMMTDDAIEAVIPPWGGELLIEILEELEWNRFGCKWMLGYSDISLLLLAFTLRTGIATAHGTNLIDLRGNYSDPVTDRWFSVLHTREGESVLQHSSERYQKEWNHASPSPCVFHLTEKTEWKTVHGNPVAMEGRLLGGCIDVIRHLAGTPYGDVAGFQQDRIGAEPILWYLENCELSTADLRRSLVQMKLAGWFRHCSGILFGRSPANRPVEGYTAEDVYRDLHEELQIPVVYDADCGHVPPQLTFVNGAYARIEARNGRGIVEQVFRP
ncbi:S66 family peptidase [Paenibacillus glufosinatiresistens]|uniref:S66 family peptidase n=1 Tax=Paenibacillus glufosinatiresistens TaxID=3070657 RepID=UPI00286EAF1C|nr:LD-carboxypeptidase [Paenibacillus sp. YX.27]